MFSSTFLLEFWRPLVFFCACLSSRIELLQSAKVIAVFGLGCGRRPRCVEWARFSLNAKVVKVAESDHRLARVRRYIANQREHHRKQGYGQELMDLLKRAGVE